MGLNYKTWAGLTRPNKLRRPISTRRKSVNASPPCKEGGGERPRALHTTQAEEAAERSSERGGRNIFSIRRKRKPRWSRLPPASESHEHGKMACCRALALHLLPASAPYRRAPRARVGAHRPRPSPVRCCAAAGDQAEPPQDAVLKAISREESSLLLLLFFSLPDSRWKGRFSFSCLCLYFDMDILDSCRRIS
jgi:hypothetical protein